MEQLKKLQADAEKQFQTAGQQSTSKMLLQLEPDRMSIGVKSTFSRASQRVSIKNLVKSTQLLLSPQISIASPAPTATLTLA